MLLFAIVGRLLPAPAVRLMKALSFSYLPAVTIGLLNAIADRLLPAPADGLLQALSFRYLAVVTVRLLKALLISLLHASGIRLMPPVIVSIFSGGLAVLVVP
jgi:hypothetical protein